MPATWSIQDFIQTDAAINLGTRRPLVSVRGEVMASTPHRERPVLLRDTALPSDQPAGGS
jgi:S1-C subfamily serine protease